MALRAAAKAKTGFKRDNSVIAKSSSSMDSYDDSDTPVGKLAAPKRARKGTNTAADDVSAPPARGRTRANQTAPEDTSTAEPSKADEVGDDSKPKDMQETGAPKRTRSTRGSSLPAAAGRGSKKAKTATADTATGAGSAGETSEGAGRRYWLMKSEPEEFSLDDLASRPQQTSHWEGVRNAQARNLMKSMRLGDEAFFYHSSCKVPAVVGVIRVVREAYPDHFAFDKNSKYHEPRSNPDAPKWWMVDVQLVRRMARPVTLAELRAEGARGPPIEDMVLINKSRLSVQPVTPQQWERILELEAAEDKQ